MTTTTTRRRSKPRLGKPSIRPFFPATSSVAFNIKTSLPQLRYSSFILFRTATLSNTRYAMSDLQEHSFQFMDLPAELRMMVYEFLPLQQQLFKIWTGVGDEPDTKDDVAITLVRYSVSLQIIRFCRTIHREAQVIMRRKARETLDITPQIIVEANRINRSKSHNGILTYVSEWLSALHEYNDLQFDDWSTLADFSNLPLLALWRRPIRLFVWQTGLQLLRPRQRPRAQTIPGWVLYFPTPEG